jgi:hypothetical protein
LLVAGDRLPLLADEEKVHRQREIIAAELHAETVGIAERWLGGNTAGEGFGTKNQ